MTYAYCRFFEEIKSRFDENYNNPRYDEINKLLKHKKSGRTLFLGDKEILISKTSGKTPKRIKYLPEGVPFLGASNINNGKVDITDCERIDVEIHNNELSSSKITKETLLITIAGSVGRCAIYQLDEEANCNQAVAVLQLNSQTANQEYVAEYLNSYIGNLFFNKLQHISSQPNINLTELEEITIIIPDCVGEITKQKQIIERLKPLKEELSALRASKIKKTEEISSIFLEKLCVKVKIPTNYFFNKGVAGTDSYFTYLDNYDRLHYLFCSPKTHLINKLASKYSLTTIKDICETPINRGEQPKYDSDGEIKVIKTINMKNKYINFEDCLKVTQNFYDLHPQAQVKLNNVLITSTGYGSLGKIDIYNSEEPAMVDGHIAILRLKDEYDPYFCTYYLRSIFGQIQFEKWFSGSSGQIEIQPTDLENFLFPTISKLSTTRQKEIASEMRIKYKAVDDIDDKIEGTKNKISKQFFDELFN